MAGRGQHLDSDGPQNPTPLSREFYAAWKRSGLTLRAVGHRAGVSVQTAWAYINGTRGGGRPSSTKTIESIAVALDIAPERAVELAGVVVPSGSEQAIRADPLLSRRDKELLVEMLHRMQRR